MKRIQKSLPEPLALTEYKQRFAQAPNSLTWSNFKSQAQRRNEVKDRLRHDQRGLCCYCENTFLPEDESVEHFISRTADHSLELDWTNLLLCCSGGERPLPESIADGAFRYEPGGTKTCGHAKLASPAVIFNPLTIPAFPRLFRFRSESGEIIPDEQNCQQSGIDPDLVAQTINLLGLRANRLSRARLATMEALSQLLEEPATSDEPFSTPREARLAAEQVPPVGTLPGFFTTIRFILGQGCEQHLQSINYQG